MTTPFDPDLQRCLDQLHAEAAKDADRWRARTGTDDPSANIKGGGELVRLGDFFLAASPSQGRLLYVLARASRARRLVEFGASYGVSSLYLAAAARDNGGRLFATEVHPQKCNALRQTFARAGVADHVTLLEGDARETLLDIAAPVEMLHLDGWKSAYLPIFRLMRPRMPAGALILADNCLHEAAQDYLREVQAPDCDCLTEIRDGLAISVVLA
ncbi:MAG: class I SAM-dependent methyltransferase [Burkholderiaceae bacterium]